MFTGKLATIYTSPADDWSSLISATGLGREELAELNPHIEELYELEPGIPVDIPWEARAAMVGSRVRSAISTLTPYQVARQELLLNIAEDPRPGKDNPRIRLYHASTSSGAVPDEVPWCSSFVNFCVEEAGLTGTDSKAARSWLRWGVAVARSNWQEGDLIVFKRGDSSWEGHVGFLVDWRGTKPTVLGGNQSNRLSVAAPYSFAAILGVRRHA